ncbi:TPA: phage virion morphogenesis protein [Pseudomonas aeruginosa]|uniref:phage virion morphogenesis protein n=1 Tax=Pseudomonas aeruginosa TaxID=287 RepID=UPI0003BAD278|nr:phage virion morphogenesis protein [Pseudomonas aeruginosa]ELI9041827.1 phage virion morphogenesis protein [Pseudomonas aeruginosa]ERX80702.1 phage virion morphogenesis protein [Pseudomonas aeruginosa 62]MBG4804864.1 phage virion morphogenesis protein [Pseudomonas aeruginosa]MCS8367277.1 phage virion morphogenesis protein [Pseudomonas aeruginosa]RUE59797.1 phage virion morphogenesis protein [Pseudomonas aeruginosa]
MSGARIELEFDSQQVTQALSAAAATLRSPTKILEDLIEPLLHIHQARFRAQQAPDGTPWTALSPRYLARKRRNRDKILTASGDLRKLAGQVEGDTLLFGTNLPYGAIHQFGGTIQRQERQSTVYFRMNERTGEVGRQFVPKRRSNFAQDVRIGPYTITMPARPWLGTSDTDDAKLLQRVMSLINSTLQN